MTGHTMTLPFVAEDTQSFAESLSFERERFFRLCQRWDSARQLADDLAVHGHMVSERKVVSWRNRTAKRIFYCDKKAVELAALHNTKTDIAEGLALAADLEARLGRR